MNTALELSQISHRFPGQERPALDSVSLSLERGVILGLLGPNGAGKTTLIRIACGLLTPGHGQVRVLGRAPAEMRRHIGMVPQGLAFEPDFTVYENLALFARLRGGEASRDVPRALEQTGLEGLAGQRAGRLSGGQQRRLNLALGLLGEPTLLILDEPTVGIDMASRELMLARIRELATAGHAILFTSHYLPEMSALCERFAVLEEGHLLSDATVDSGPVLEVAGKGRLSELLDELFSPLPGARQLAPGHWSARPEVEALPELMRQLASHAGELTRFQWGSGNIERDYRAHLARGVRQ